jgi:hypothetical protein
MVSVGHPLTRMKKETAQTPGNGGVLLKLQVRNADKVMAMLIPVDLYCLFFTKMRRLTWNQCPLPL